MLRDDILKEIIRGKGDPVSGQALADKYHVSRNAIWKHVLILQDQGYMIKVIRNKGYYIPKEADMISEEGIREYLIEDLKAANIKFYDRLDSTNDEAKRLLSMDSDISPAIIVADEQTFGRGRNGKMFYSPKGGVYLSFVLSKDIPSFEANVVTMAAAVAITRVIEPIIKNKLDLKWVNDVFFDGKKVAGILTEAVTDLETNTIKTIILGIGLDYNLADIPDEFKHVVGSLDIKDIPRIEIIGKIISEFYLLIQEFNVEVIEEEYFARMLED